MGRAMLFIVMGLMVAVGYTLNGINTQKQTMTTRTVSMYNKSAAQNLAHTGIQMAIQEYNSDNNWSGDNFEHNNGTVDLTLTAFINAGTEYIRIKSNAAINGTEHRIIATYDVSQKEQLIPTFNTGLGIFTDDFTFSLGGSANANGNDQTGQCADVPGVLVKSLIGQTKVGFNSRIDGNPDDVAGISTSTDYDAYANLVSRLATQPGVTHLSGNYKGNMGTETNPSIFFIDEYTKLSGGISEGYGIMVVRQGGSLGLESGLDISGNFTFNGLIIFENAYSMDAKDTPTINGSVIVGSTDNNTIDIDISGNVVLQHDCTAQQYADVAAENNLTVDRIYKQTSSNNTTRAPKFIHIRYQICGSSLPSLNYRD